MSETIPVKLPTGIIPISLPDISGTAITILYDRVTSDGSIRVTSDGSERVISDGETAYPETLRLRIPDDTIPIHLED